MKFYILLRERQIKIGIVSGVILLVVLEGLFSLVKYILGKEFPELSGQTLSTLTLIILISCVFLYLGVMEILFRFSKKN